jgi:hypothetical protein
MTVNPPRVSRSACALPGSFTTSSKSQCVPTAEDSNLQVIQAFITAYNDRDLDSLRELTSESVTIADMSGIPHLGEDDWTGVARWAEGGLECRRPLRADSLGHVRLGVGV